MRLLTNTTNYGIMSTYGKCSKEQRNIVWYKGQAFCWPNILRSSQGRSCTNNCGNKQKSSRTRQKIQYETATCIVPSDYAISICGYLSNLFSIFCFFEGGNNGK